jgi:hypothetical protein
VLSTYFTEPSPQSVPFRWLVKRSDTKSTVAEILTDEEPGYDTEQQARDLTAKLNGLAS